MRIPRTYRLRITLDGMYPGIVAACEQPIHAVLPHRVTVQPTPSRAVVVNAYSSVLPDLFPQHGPGMKHERAINLADWQREITQEHPADLIRGLIHSDGSRHINRIRHGELGIPWRVMNRWTISVARRNGVARLDELVGPKR